MDLFRHSAAFVAPTRHFRRSVPAVFPLLQSLDGLRNFNYLFIILLSAKTSPFISYVLFHQCFGQKTEYGADNEFGE